MTLVLGLDPSLACTGMVLVDWATHSVEGFGVARTRKSDGKRAVRVADDDAERCMTLAVTLRRWLDERPPEVVVVELPHGGGQSSRAVRAMALATGTVAAVVELARVPHVWVTPGDAKKAATGSRNASKAEVQAAMLGKFKWPDVKGLNAAEWEAIADAAAACLAAERSLRHLEGRVDGTWL